MRFLILLLLPLTCSAKSSDGKFQESISVSMLSTGDIVGNYSFSGPVNGVLESYSDLPESKCSAQNLFRKAIVSKRKVVEVWVNFICSFEGQKRTYKLPRYYLDLGKSEQKIHVPQLDKNIHGIELDFRDLSLQKGK